MFPKDRDYKANPFLIKRRVDGEVRTFKVKPTSYEPETGLIHMIDVETEEYYYGTAKDNKIEIKGKAKVIQAETYEEYLYLKYGK